MTTNLSRRALFGAAAPAGPALRPFGRHLAFGADPATQVTVSWQVPGKVTGPYVRFGTSPSTLGAPVAAEVRPLESKLSWQHPEEHDFPPHAPATYTQYFLHAKLTGLSPDTTYHYVLGHAGYDPVAADRLGEVATFRTAGTSGAFTFTAAGDQGLGYNALNGASQIADFAPAFHLALGDLSYAMHEPEDKPTSEDFEYDARKWDSFFAQNDAVASGIPWMITLGHREYEKFYDNTGNGGVRARFAMPDNAWSGSTGIYAWRYHNVGFMSLDSGEVCYRFPAKLDYTAGKQLKWIDAQLGRFRADPAVEFVVVYCGHSVYSTGDRYGAERGAQEKWAPLFDKHGVDLVLTAHNRLYERTDPIKAGKGTKKTGVVHPAADGTTYVTAGGGGQALDAFYKNAPESYLGHVNDAAATMKSYKKGGKTPTDTVVTWSRVRYRGYGLVVVDVVPGQLTVRALGETGDKVDEVVLRRG
ncbi:metallophosphoesterase family protein [Amycolatopsis sp. SID8362]|uniref:purple acid phosphatase family protein n=1 Tax=Amycolatopsis sp. SID8362 TaxID=2690346 RepID=UPI00137190FA|nr:metallophosphoesterase family protein [Amycolatopsis sp. SID8362]NBH06756.1 phosphoesterase [Amycolatopsis sp. SID8362]NED43453.1 metallophosphoesterase family protein [Amycolatopsis sp. SID8362]